MKTDSARAGIQSSDIDKTQPQKIAIALCPKFQEYFRIYQPPTLAVWGKNDPFFLPQGAEAFKRDNPRAEVYFYNTGHFALETHTQEIADAIKNFLGRRNIQS